MFNIGSTIGKIFGTDKALTSIVDGTKNALDKLVYTSEERAEDEAKSITEARSMIIQWMNATQGQNLARRIIALVITSIWVLQYLIVSILSVIAVWVKDPLNYLESAKVIGDNAQSMTTAMMLILAFYFSAPYMGTLAEGVLNKFNTK